MKTFIKACLLFLLPFTTYTTGAQQKDIRPKLFKGVQNKVAYPKADLEKIFTKIKGNTYQVSLPGNFNFTGTIVSSVQRYDNLKSYLIKSDVLKGAIFAVSKIINDDKSITYAGRIINENYADGFELKVDASGNYFLNKINMDELLPDRQ